MERNDFETKKLVEQLVDRLIVNHKEYDARFRDFTFSVRLSSNNKYFRIVIRENGIIYQSHAFVDKITGDLFSPSNKKKPRYNLYKDIEYLKGIADWAGGYLLY